MSNHNSSEKNERDKKESDTILNSELNNCGENIIIDEIKESSQVLNKYENYIIDKKYELVLDLIKFIGYTSFSDTSYIKFTDIQNEKVSIYINNMLDALKTVFKTYSIRSMARKNKDKRFCLNILRQLLQDIGYTLKMKTYPLIRNNIITSSTKYRIIKKK
jgi:hypothetical protein